MVYCLCRCGFAHNMLIVAEISHMAIQCVTSYGERRWVDLVLNTIDLAKAVAMVRHEAHASYTRRSGASPYDAVLDVGNGAELERQVRALRRCAQPPTPWREAKLAAVRQLTAR